MRNIELFDEIVAVVLSKLYDEFPLDTNFEIKELYNSHLSDDLSQCEKFHKIAIKTLKWLEQNGFINICSLDISGKSAVGVMLSLKGLELLRQKPLKLNKTFGENLKNALDYGTKESIKQAINLILSSSLKYILKD